MFENIAAIDAGTSAVKCVCVRTGFRDFQVKSFSYHTIESGYDSPLDAISDALEKLLAEVNLKGYTILTNLPMEKAIIRNITFPFNDIAKIAEAIPYEAEENIPFKLDDLIIDFQSLKSPTPEKGRILLGAAHKDTIYDFLHPFSQHNLKPVHMGMEANALFECYKYFNRIDDESIIQLDIGNNKTIINIISGNTMLYTRSILSGISLIHKSIADLLDITYDDAIRIFESLNIDLSSLENNLQRGFYKNLNIPKQKFIKIFQECIEIVNELLEQINLTIKSFSVEYSKVEFSRIMISGGGSNLTGIGSLLSKDLDLPVTDLPFLDEYKEQMIRSQFPTAFGTVLAYINQKRSKINFLKGEFTPDVEGVSKKIYYLSGTFLAASVLILFLNVVLSLIIISGINSKNNQLLDERYRKYFGKNPMEAPIASATKLLKAEQKDLDIITSLIAHDTSIMSLLDDMLKNFSASDGFDLKNLVINENIVRFDGSSADSRSIDTFKQNLLDSKKFDSVTLNIRSSTKNQIMFTMTIKQKVQGDVKTKSKAVTDDQPD